ncbi:glycosyltransferase [uncultured Chryseobacterium sp.]|uniref:glycosyltransferase n=1 Tax=uncultured Chryseobacterium sp. TaxID=259322 RepID=UPI0025E92A8F|nr:glycosyltransferase [uncultured Chryseobacterium sp.]
MISEKRDLDMLSDNNKPTVAVYMITYNQEKFIQQSIESVMNQKTNFNYKLFIGEDCSTDNTRAICISLKEKYPDKIHLVLNENNLGATKNAKNIFSLSFGSHADYIALIEGDDYWTDPLKLQKQVDFLEKNKEYSMCFHRTDELYVNGEIKTSGYTESDTHEKTFTLSDLFIGNFIHTPSVIFRNSISIPDWTKDACIGDYIIWLYAAEKGKIKYLPDSMAVYRSGVGIWSSQDKEQIDLKWMKSLAVIIMNTESSEIRDGLQNSFYNSSIRFMTSIYPNYPSLINQHIYKYYKNLSFLKLLKMTIKKVF